MDWSLWRWTVLLDLLDPTGASVQTPTYPKVDETETVTQERGKAVSISEPWSEWRMLIKEEWDQAPENTGVYRIRAVDESGKPIPLNRVAGIDKDGILYVGFGKEEHGVRGRIKDFDKTAVRPNSNYGLGPRKYTLLKYQERLSIFEIQFQYCLASTEVDAKKLEDADLYAYRDEFLELPPLNSKGPPLPSES